MTTDRLKLAYAVITLGVATRVYVIGERHADPIWLAKTYLVMTILFSALVVHLTLKAAHPQASFDERYFGTINSLVSYWTLFPPAYFVWKVFQSDLTFALVAFSLSSGVVAGVYLLTLAFRLDRPSR